MAVAAMELRGDGLHISGYVNVPGRRSRPVMTPRGRVVEVIEQGAFARAIAKAQDIKLMIDHERTVASTKAGSLKLHEDEIGLRAEAVVTDGQAIEDARAGRMSGWSFGMRNAVDEMEERADSLPIRHVKELELSEVTITVKKSPVYTATMLEVRAGEETEMELRAEGCRFELKDCGSNEEYKARLKSLEYKEG